MPERLNSLHKFLLLTEGRHFYPQTLTFIIKLIYSGESDVLRTALDALQREKGSHYNMHLWAGFFFFSPEISKGTFWSAAELTLSLLQFNFPEFIFHSVIPCGVFLSRKDDVRLKTPRILCKYTLKKNGISPFGYSIIDLHHLNWVHFPRGYPNCPECKIQKKNLILYSYLCLVSYLY